MSNAEWHGTLREGSGKMRLASGAYEGAFTWASRFENGKGTNPEELIAAAHAGCFSMAFSAELTKAGFPPTVVRTEATVHLEAGKGITKIDLVCGAEIPRIDKAEFHRLANVAKVNCPVSKALSAVPVTLEATLKE
jgi:osmotically inducible protein OsmC